MLTRGPAVRRGSPGLSVVRQTVSPPDAEPRGHRCALSRCPENTYHLAHARYATPVQCACCMEYTVMLIWGTRIDSVVSWRLCLSVLDCDMHTESWCVPEGGRNQTMRQNARQHLEAQLQRLAQQREDTKKKLRALARQTQHEQRYRYGEFVERAGLVHLDPGTLLGGLCALAAMSTASDTASRWKVVGEARLAEHRRRKAHRKRSALLTVDSLS